MGVTLRAAQRLMDAAWRVAHWARAEKATPRSLTPVLPGTGGWFGLVRESFTGAWQRNIEINTDTVLTHGAVFRCISLIASDISKCRLRLMEKDQAGVWTEVPENGPQGSAFWPVLRRPNRYQSRIQFYANWMESKLIHGNTYVLKERDQRNVVVRMHVLNPLLVTVLVAPDNSVYYELRSDNLSGVPDESLTVPASEIIHDRYSSTFNHPLVGISPLRACGLAATQGLRIQENSTKFFANGAQPGGVLTAPGFIDDATAARLKAYWDENYGAGGPNVGRVAVLGDGLKYEPMMMTAVDAQMVEQLRMTAETVAGVFGVPMHMLGIGEPPTYNNIEALNAQYYMQCLQIHIESIEELLDGGLGLGPQFANAYGTEFDLDDLLRMDSSTKMGVVSTGVQRAIFSPNEARLKFNMKPVVGGELPVLQEQNWPINILAEREIPEREPTPPASTAAPTTPAPIEESPANAEAGASPAARAVAYRSGIVHDADRIQRYVRAIT